MDWFRLVGFFAIGKICIYMLQVFPLTFTIADWVDHKTKYVFLGKPTRCNLCLGVWVYAFWVYALKMYPVGWYIPIVSEFVVGAAASLIMQLIELGWQTKFSVIQIGG